MAKKKQTTEVVEQELVEVMEQPIVETLRVNVAKKPTTPSWEIKDRVYVLTTVKAL